jgi:hypothetical protein
MAHNVHMSICSPGAKQRRLHEYVARQYKRTTTLGTGICCYGERTSGKRDNRTFGALPTRCFLQDDLVIAASRAEQP